MKTLVRCFLTFALLAVTILPMLTHNSSSPQQTAFRSGADIYMDGPVPIPPINRQRPAASSHFIALRPGAEIYMDGPVPIPPVNDRGPVAWTPQKTSVSIG